MNLLQVKIGDFGLATTNIKLTDLTLNLDRSLTDENQSDMTGQIGTAMYVAPEINAGKVIAAYSQKVDIYSLGVIFFEMCHPPLTTGMERIKILSALRYVCLKVTQINYVSRNYLHSTEFLLSKF